MFRIVQCLFFFPSQGYIRNPQQTLRALFVLAYRRAAHLLLRWGCLVFCGSRASSVSVIWHHNRFPPHGAGAGLDVRLRASFFGKETGSKEISTHRTIPLRQFFRRSSPSLRSGERIGFFSTHNRDAKVAEIAKTAARIGRASPFRPGVRFRKISSRVAPVCARKFFFSSPCLRCSLRDRLVQHRCSERFRQFGTPAQEGKVCNKL